MRIARFWRALAVFLVAAGADAAADPLLDGRYRGVAATEGAALEIAPDRVGFAGRLILPGEGEHAFEADRRVDMAEAVIDLAGRPTLMQAMPQPYGAEVALVPVNPDGSPDLAASRVLRFLEGGQDRVSYPEGYAFPPQGAGTRIAAYSFLRSYAYWRPQPVADGYLALAERFRTLMRLFPAVQLDVTWRLCNAPQGDRAVAKALRGDALDCRAIDGGLYSAQTRGTYAAFRDRVARETEILAAQVRCADGYVMERATCAEAARQVAKAAAALETTAAVLARYR